MGETEQLWVQIKDKEDVRQKLSLLRKKLRDSKGQKAFLAQIAGEENTLLELLGHEDAKTRKNAALLLGVLGKQEFLEPVYNAYVMESQLFVKSAYLTAMRNFDCGNYMEHLKLRLNELSAMEMTTDDQKHLTDEMRELSALVVKAEGTVTHTFREADPRYDIVLLTNRNLQQLTLDQLEELLPQTKVGMQVFKTRIFNAGIMAAVENLGWTERIRTYQELLFTVKGLKTCPKDPNAAADAFAASELSAFLKRNHDGEPPFYFRVELRSRMDAAGKSVFVKKFAARLEKSSGRFFINTTSDYELELRLIENKEGGLNVLVRLFTCKDQRFSYRKESVASGIRPVNAAAAVQLAKAYLQPNASVLDPFCGAGTMLIERNKAVRSRVSYGIDIQADAVAKAKINTEAANQTIHYINRDFFDFKHEHLFDEIITDMPFVIGRTTEEDILQLYRRFFQKAGELMKEDGTMVLYSHNRDFVRQLASANGWKAVEECEMSMKEETFVFVLKKVI